MLYNNLLQVIITILAENGETRALTLIKLINSYTNNVKIEEPMVFEYNILSRNNLIVIPLTNVRIDWGDGEITLKLSHIYKIIVKKYRVKIYKNNNDLEISTQTYWPNNITDFISIGRIGIKSLKFMFRYNEYEFKIYPNWDTTNITDMSNLFSYAYNFNQKIGDNWDTTNVNSMDGMFYKAHKFNQKIGDNWDTTSVTDMFAMFCEAANFNQKIGDNWNTSNLLNMGWMFWGATNFNQKIGDNWDTTKVVNMSCMFGNIPGLRQKIGHNWKISETVDITGMFSTSVDPELLPAWYKIK